MQLPEGVPPELLKKHWFYEQGRATLKVTQMTPQIAIATQEFFMTFSCFSAKELYIGTSRPSPTKSAGSLALHEQNFFRA